MGRVPKTLAITAGAEGINPPKLGVSLHDLCTRRHLLGVSVCNKPEIKFLHTRRTLREKGVLSHAQSTNAFQPSVF